MVVPLVSFVPLSYVHSKPSLMASTACADVAILKTQATCSTLTATTILAPSLTFSISITTRLSTTDRTSIGTCINILLNHLLTLFIQI